MKERLRLKQIRKVFYQSKKISYLYHKLLGADLRLKSNSTLVGLDIVELKHAYTNTNQFQLLVKVSFSIHFLVSKHIQKLSTLWESHGMVAIRQLWIWFDNGIGQVDLVIDWHKEAVQTVSTYIATDLQWMDVDVANILFNKVFDSSHWQWVAAGIACVVNIYLIVTQ